MAHAWRASFAVFRDLFLPRWPDTMVEGVRVAERPVTPRQVVSSETTKTSETFENWIESLPPVDLAHDFLQRPPILKYK